MNEEIKKELDWIRDIFEERKEKFYIFIQQSDELEDQLEDASTEEERDKIQKNIYALDHSEYHYDENSDTRYFCMYDDDFMDLFDLLEEHLEEDDLEELIERVEDEGLIPPGEAYDDEVEDYYCDTKAATAFWYCVENEVIPNRDFYSECEFHYDYNEKDYRQ